MDNLEAFWFQWQYKGKHRSTGRVIGNDQVTTVGAG
jgi:hypothetical protein